MMDVVLQKKSLKKKKEFLHPTQSRILDKTWNTQFNFLGLIYNTNLVDKYMNLCR